MSDTTSLPPSPSLRVAIVGSRRENTVVDNTETLTIDETYIINAPTRGEVADRHVIELDDKKVIEFTYADETVWMADATTIDEVFPGTSGQLRSLETSNGIFEIPTEVQTREQSRSGLATKIALKIVKIFTKKAVESVVKELAENLEEKQLGNQTGLFQLDSRFELIKPTFETDGKYILFLHGTASSTTESFGELKGTRTWNYLTQTYQQNVLAFQHETLTKSPLENVRDLVTQLPAKATLTLVSHSRGGLVGDILSRFCVDSTVQRGFSANEKNYLRKQDRTADLEHIEAIEKAIQGKKIVIDKFIRVACTASGTTLASRRLDIYFNVIFNVIGLATAQAANPLYVAFKDLIAALIKSKDNASVLPGLEVQNPRSAFNQMLNNANPETVITTPLIVISGDAKMSLRWQGLKVALTNLFFWGDNDFVVDTRSMYNGAKRAKDKVQYFFDEGSDVSHFNYFKNTKTQNMLLLALKHSGETLIPGFSMLENRRFTDAEIRSIDLSLPGGRVFRNQVSGKKPIVVLLPGIMGSTLTVRDQLVWIDFLGFAAGSLTSLLHSPDNNQNVRADALVGSSYKKLTEFLSRDYDVVTFPFDWRIDMVENARLLNRKIVELMSYQQPIKLVGHSMGGVLIRDFIVHHPETWQKLKASPDFRLLFLGSPLGGSFRIPYVLFGLDSLINTLDFVDISNSQKELLRVFSQFPGILSLLPLTTDTANDFARRETWETMRNAFGDAEWPIPDDALLNQFKTYRDTVLDTTIDFSQAVYIAGQSRRNKQTVSGYQISYKNTFWGNTREELEFLATKEGDESVTWASGIPQSMIAQNTVYYSDVTHGELANDPKLFSAIVDILTTGLTNQLKRTPPLIRSTEKQFKARSGFDLDLSPEGVERSLMGLGIESGFTPGATPITVSVSNGDLKYALYPVMAGHFHNDGILSAEKAIDWHLHQELSRRHQLGLYPGPIGTSEIIRGSNPKGFPGTIIVGLGKQGELTEYLVTSTVEQGAAKYLADLNNRPAPVPTGDPKPAVAGISVLLIGSGYGGLRIQNAIRAIIQGIQNANTKIRQIYRESPKIIDAIEFIELYQDRALACMKAISAIEQEESRSLNIFRNGNKINQLAGWRERLPIDDTTEWWTRINVSRDTDNELATPGFQPDFRFNISTDAARVETQMLTTIDNTLIGMLDELSTKDAWSPELAKAIFELMIPNAFKDQVKRQNNINWILDKHAAAFPWELLQDSVANARPLSINAGMIRQLATGDFRNQITPVVERTAIVVGDPELKNPSHQLPAARREGQKVADLLSLQGFSVVPSIKESAAQILFKLFSKNYKIVHLAGHGVFSTKPGEPNGMLIGPGSFLNAGHIDQMSHVPELVFVNCCYLGQTDGEAERNNQNRVQLAANIGTQLIEIGVKAVVVAGWAVNDQAALEFAERFYQYLFEGNNFGEAVRKARKTIFEKYGSQNNTWGAYQCYGDPFYKLTTNSLAKKDTYDFVIPEEAEIELSNLLNQIESGGYDVEETLLTMEAIETGTNRASIRTGRIIELQALLYSRLNKYELAIAKFKELLKEEKASFSFSATEQYCNIQVKLYAQKVRKANQHDKEALVQEATDALKRIVLDLEGLIRFGDTIERINILASTYKRLALFSTGDDKRDAYQCSASSYRKAFEFPGNRNKFYPLANWLSIESALVLAGKRMWGKDKLPKKANVQNELDLELDNIRRKTERDFWDWVAEANILLCQYLLGEKTITYDQILESYTDAWKRIGSEGQRQTEIEQMEFLEDAFSLAVEKEKGKTILEEIRRLKTALELMV